MSSKCDINQHMPISYEDIKQKCFVVFAAATFFPLVLFGISLQSDKPE